MDAHRRALASRVASVLGVGLLAAALSGGIATAHAQSPKRGGTLSISLEHDLPGLDPLVFASFNEKQAGITVYDTLLDIDAKGKLVPGLAERFEAAPDALSFKLKLREGVRFHDGTACDAAAVVEHFRRLMDPKNRFRSLADLRTIASVEATGPLEVSFRMSAPSAQFPAVLADVAGMVVSPTAVKKLGADFVSNPVGTGPFVFKEWRRGAQIVFKRNTDYWRGPVHLDEVVLVPMPDDQTRVSSLKAGNLDVAMNVQAKDVIEARGNKKLTVHDPGSLGTSFIMINTQAPDVSDVRVRRAMAHAIDRESINRALYKNLPKIANTPFGSGLAPHEQVDGYPKYDPAAAKKLLAEYGKPVKLKFNISSAPQTASIAQVLQQMWKKVGIETEIVPGESVHNQRITMSREYQIIGWRWQGGIDPDRNVYIFFHSKGTANRTAFSSPKMDELLDLGRSTTDPAERLKHYRAISNLLAQELPYLFLFYFNNYSVSNASVKGIVPVPDGLIRVRDVWKER